GQGPFPELVGCLTREAAEKALPEASAWTLPGPASRHSGRACGQIDGVLEVADTVGQPGVHRLPAAEDLARGELADAFALNAAALLYAIEEKVEVLVDQGLLLGLLFIGRPPPGRAHVLQAPALGDRDVQ